MNFFLYRRVVPWTQVRAHMSLHPDRISMYKGTVLLQLRSYSFATIEKLQTRYSNKDQIFVFKSRGRLKLLRFKFLDLLHSLSLSLTGNPKSEGLKEILLSSDYFPISSVISLKVSDQESICKDYNLVISILCKVKFPQFIFKASFADWSVSYLPYNCYVLPRHRDQVFPLGRILFFPHSFRLLVLRSRSSNLFEPLDVC